MTAHTILIVAKDVDLRDTLCGQLCLYEEFHVLQAAAATQGIRMVRSNSIDLVITASDLVDLDGREGVRVLRKSSFKAPIIVLGEQDTDADAYTILALEAGASDCVTKPFGFVVLLARIRAQLRQYEEWPRHDSRSD